MRIRDGGKALGFTKADEEEGDEAPGARGKLRRRSIGCGDGVPCHGEDGGGEVRRTPWQRILHEPEGDMGGQEGVTNADADEDVPVVIAERPEP